MRPKKRGEKLRKKWGRRSLGQWLRSADAKCALVVLVGALMMFGLFCAVSAPERYSLTVGSISHQTITATKDVVDEITTESRREAAADAVEPTYHFQEGASEQVLSDLAAIFEELRTTQQYGLTLRKEGETDAQFLNREFTETELEYARGLITTITLSDYQIETLLRTDTDTMEEMISTVTTAVQNTLNTTIREGQVTQSINNILQIVGYRVETSLFQNIVPTVLKSCVAPNMVIDQEATEQARQKARDAVEPVVYLQGQNIIREGERVSRNQVEMVRALGMLQDNAYDYTIYAGAALLVAACVVMLVALLRLLDRPLLHDLRGLMVLMTVMVIAMGLCMLCIKGLNAYLAPIALAAMLLTGLLGVPAGIASIVPMALLVSGVTVGGNSNYSTEMVHLLVMGIVSGTLSVVFLRERPQRVLVAVCGLVAAVANLAMLVAMELMTSSAMDGLANSAAWAMGGGMVSGLMALALQPVFETTFNLATPSKLLELANPNQPLLRRLLLEAPGTYHHSIIVANLSEAAAERIGANPLLARTGAYFHDVGKLKRPLYFKENQMGENPHDHTDPYVSAAIVTTHTRDGLQLAQKYRLPMEIQRIIVEHHGDTPVMFFYHKALQQANGKPVDIADFRYDGTRPTSKESAIVMLADTIEAAVRSMPDPTPQAIERFIERLVRGKLEDGQLSNSPLTLRDIDGICEAFAKVLNGVFHERIEYPSTPVPKRDPFFLNQRQEEQKHAEEGAKEEQKHAAERPKEEPPAPAGETAAPPKAEASPAPAGEQTSAAGENAAGEAPAEAAPEKQAYEEPEAEKVNVEFNEEIPALSERTEDRDPTVGD